MMRLPVGNGYDCLVSSRTMDHENVDTSIISANYLSRRRCGTPKAKSGLSSL